MLCEATSVRIYITVYYNKLNRDLRSVQNRTTLLCSKYISTSYFVPCQSETVCRLSELQEMHEVADFRCEYRSAWDKCSVEVVRKTRVCCQNMDPSSFRNVIYLLCGRSAPVVTERQFVPIRHLLITYILSAFFVSVC